MGFISSLKKVQIICVFIFLSSWGFALEDPVGLPLYYWREPTWHNFGDILSVKLVERILGSPVRIYQKNTPEQKLLAIGSIFYFAREGDVVWGSGINGKKIQKEDYVFKQLDIRAVRGPITRQFLKEKFGIEVPEIYGDPALLIPYLFPEFRRKKHPQIPYLIVAHYLDQKLFPKSKYEHIAYSTDPWYETIEKMLNSEFVISTSLHGIIVAEAFGIPARLLRVSEKEPLLKYQDYYLGTNRPDFQYAISIDEALEMGGEPPFECDLEMLYDSFPFEFWPGQSFHKPNFSILPYEETETKY